MIYFSMDLDLDAELEKWKNIEEIFFAVEQGFWTLEVWRMIYCRWVCKFVF